MNRRRRSLLERLAAVPHYRAEERQVGRGQRPAKQRQLVGIGVVAGVAIGIVDGHELELRCGRDRDADADEALREQHVVGGAPRLNRRDVGQRRVGAVVRSEDRVRPGGRLEAGLDAGGADAHVVVGLVARHASPAVPPEIEEERVGLGDDRKAGHVDRPGLARLVVHGVDRPVRPGAVGAAGPGRDERARDHHHETNRAAPSGVLPQPGLHRSPRSRGPRRVGCPSLATIGDPQFRERVAQRAYHTDHRVFSRGSGTGGERRQGRTPAAERAEIRTFARRDRSGQRQDEASETVTVSEASALRGRKTTRRRRSSCTSRRRRGCSASLDRRDEFA